MENTPTIVDADPVRLSAASRLHTLTNIRRIIPEKGGNGGTANPANYMFYRIGIDEYSFVSKYERVVNCPLKMMVPRDHNPSIYLCSSSTSEKRERNLKKIHGQFEKNCRQVDLPRFRPNMYGMTCVVKEMLNLKVQSTKCGYHSATPVATLSSLLQEVVQYGQPAKVNWDFLDWTVFVSYGPGQMSVEIANQIDSIVLNLDPSTKNRSLLNIESISQSSLGSLN